MNFKIFTIFLLLCLLIVACKKFENTHINKIASEKVEVNNTLITATSLIVDVGEDGITEYGHCWSIDQVPVITDAKTQNTSDIKQGYYTDTLRNLIPNTTYQIRSYIKNENNVLYGETKIFTTSLTGIEITTYDKRAISNTSATVKGRIKNLNSIKILGYGHCWGINPLPTILDNKTLFGELSQDIEFTSSLNNLQLEIPVYIRAYIIADNNTILYSDTSILIIPKLQVQTLNSIIISSTTVLLEGAILKMGLNEVTDHGFCWSFSNSYPNLNDSIISLGSIYQIGNFSSNLNNIFLDVTYYYRAYAISNGQISYGNVLTFTSE